MDDKYSMTLKLFDTEDDAQAFCDELNENAYRYAPLDELALYTPWESPDGTDDKFAVWYWHYKVE